MGVREYKEKIVKEYGMRFLKTISKRRIPDNRAEVIAKQVLQKKCGHILEIGRFKGFSLGLFAYHSLADSIITSIDPVFHKEVIDIINLSNHVELILIHGTSNIVPIMNEKYDYVLIDGDHSYKWVSTDWANIRGSLNEGAIVFFDNINHAAGGGKVFEDLKGYKKTIVDKGSGYLKL